jgi:exosortase
LHSRWLKFDEPYAIGYLVCAIAIWLIVEQRKPILSAVVSPSVGAGLLFLLSAAMSLAARLVQFQLLQQLMMPVSLWLLIVCLLGWRIGRLLLFPLAMIYLAIPIWDALVPPLRWFTVAITQRALVLLGVPAYVAGYEITLPAGKIIVEDGCSGLNLFMASVVVGSLQFYLMAQRLWRRAAVLLAAIVIGVVDNWVRVITIVLVGHFTEMRSSLVHHHVNFGWAVFVGGLVPFFVVVRWFERGGRTISAPASAAIRDALPYQRIALYGAGVALVGAILLSATTVLEQRVAQPMAWPAPPLALSTQAEWLPLYIGYDQQQAWRVNLDGASYQVLVLTYLHQSVDKKLIYYSNRIADERHTRVTERFMASASLPVNQSIIDANGARVVWWFYLIDHRVITGGVAAKWRQLIGLLRGDQAASLVAISTQCLAADCSDILQSDRGALGVRKLLYDWLPLLGINEG